MAIARRVSSAGRATSSRARCSTRCSPPSTGCRPWSSSPAVRRETGSSSSSSPGRYPGIVKTTLDGVNQTAYLTGQSPKLGARRLLLLLGRDALGGPLQELEDVLQHVAARRGRLDHAARRVPLHAGAEHQARPVRASGRRGREECDGPGRRARRTEHGVPLRLEPAARSASSSGWSGSRRSRSSRRCRSRRATTSVRSWSRSSRSPSTHPTETGRWPRRVEVGGRRSGSARSSPASSAHR